MAGCLRGERPVTCGRPAALCPQMVEKQAGAEEADEVRHVCLPWYPDRLAYQLNVTRMDIRCAHCLPVGGGAVLCPHPARCGGMGVGGGVIWYGGLLLGNGREAR